MTGLEAAVAILGNTILQLEERVAKAEQEATMWRERYEATVRDQPQDAS